MKQNKLSLILYVSIISILHQQFIIADSTNTVDIQNLPSPYCELKEILPFNDHGWYYNATWIEKLIKQNNILNVIEVGSWLGLSTRHIASLLPEIGKLYAVDTWKGSVETYAWQDLLPTLYEQFLSNIIHSGFAHKIIPIKMSSQQAAAEYFSLNKDAIDLIYLDAAHDTVSVTKDLESYFPFVMNNKGILCGDDWGWESVRIAVIQFAQKYNLTVYGAHNFWFIAEQGSFNVHSFVDAHDDIWKFPKIQKN